MRDPNRLDKFYTELCQIHKEHFPDWRFGQLCSNFFEWFTNIKEKDPFFIEENKMIDYIIEFKNSFKKE